MMEIVRINEIALKETPRGVSARQVIDMPHINIMNLVLGPGEEVPGHVTPVDVLFHVLEGRGTIRIGDEKAEVKAGEIIVSPAGIPHGLQVSGDGKLSVLVMKTPNPKTIKK